MIKTLVRFAPMKTLAAAGLAACLALSGAADAAPLNLSTGVQTHIESGRDIDNIWTIASTDVSLSTNKLETVLPGFPIPPWVADSPGVSKWLVPVDFHQKTAPPNVDYQYSTTFTISAADIAAGATLSGRYLSDNQTTSITLSGAAAASLGPLNTFGNSYTTWTSLNAYSFTTAGTYTLTFDVHNGPGNAGNPTGFRFEGGYTSAVPEPASLAMSAVSVLALGGLSWKRRSARQG